MAIPKQLKLTTQFCTLPLVFSSDQHQLLWNQLAERVRVNHHKDLSSICHNYLSANCYEDVDGVPTFREPMSSKLEHDALYERAVSYIAALRAGRIPEKDMFRLKTDFNVAVVRTEGINFSGGSKILIRQVLDSWRRITNPHTQIKFALTDAVYAVAVEGHESWRRTTRDLVENAPHPAADGKELRDPRWKSFDGTDEQFEHLPESFRRVTDGARELDIANLPFEMLSPKWQESNIVAGMSVYSALAEAIVSAGFDASVVPVHVMTFSASAVHEVWRSEQGEWSPDLNVDYTSLPAKEMFKDADKLRLGIEAFNRWEEHTGVRFHSVI